LSGVACITRQKNLGCLFFVSVIVTFRFIAILAGNLSKAQFLKDIIDSIIAPHWLQKRTLQVSLFPFAICTSPSFHRPTSIVCGQNLWHSRSFHLQASLMHLSLNQDSGDAWG
jgi:hypothetical protein